MFPHYEAAQKGQTCYCLCIYLVRTGSFLLYLYVELTLWELNDGFLIGLEVLVTRRAKLLTAQPRRPESFLFRIRVPLVRHCSCQRTLDEEAQSEQLLLRKIRYASLSNASLPFIHRCSYD